MIKLKKFLFKKVCFSCGTIEEHTLKAKKRNPNRKCNECEEMNTQIIQEEIKEFRTCELCEGKGKIQEVNFEMANHLDDPFATKVETCTYCKGTGQVELHKPLPKKKEWKVEF